MDYPGQGAGRGGRGRVFKNGLRLGAFASGASPFAAGRGAAVELSLEPFGVVSGGSGPSSGLAAGGPAVGRAWDRAGQRCGAAGI